VGLDQAGIGGAIFSRHCTSVYPSDMSRGLLVLGLCSEIPAPIEGLASNLMVVIAILELIMLSVLCPPSAKYSWSEGFHNAISLL